MALMDADNVYPLEDLTEPWRGMRRKVRKKRVQAADGKVDLQVAQADMFLSLGELLHYFTEVLE